MQTEDRVQTTKSHDYILTQTKILTTNTEAHNFGIFLFKRKENKS